MAKLIKMKDPTTGQVQSHDAKYWARAKAKATARRGGPSSVQVNPLSGQTVRHSAKAWQGIHKQYQQRYGPEDITAPMGPHEVALALDAASRQKFGPQYQTLAKETSASQQQDRNVTDWFGQYKAALNNATAQSQAAQGQASNFTNQFANSSSALDASQRQQLQQQQEQSAAQRGATVDPSIAATGQQADQSRRQALGQFGALQAQTGANTTAYMADKGRIAQGSELQAHGAEATRRQGISELVRGLQGQEGDYRTTLRGQLQASERQNQLARATFGLNEQKAAADAAAKAAATAQSNTNNRRTTQTSSQNNRRTNQTSSSNNRRTNQTSSQNNRRTNRQSDVNNRRTQAGKGGGGKNTVDGVPHDKTYQTGYSNAYKWLFNHPVPTRGSLVSRDTLIALVRKATGANYAAAYDAVNAVRKKYPQIHTPLTQKLPTHG